MIHPSALISATANIAKNVSIGPFTIVHDGVSIGENCNIGAYCEIGYPTPLANQNELIIQNDSLIRSHSVLYMGSSFGPGLQTGHHVTIRENTQAGKDWRIGTLADIQGDIIIGDYVRIHSNVFTGKGAVLGNYVWLFPHVLLTNDPHPPSDVCLGVIVEDYAAVGARVTVLPGLTIGQHSLVAAHSCVTRDVASHTVVRGVPAKPVAATTSIHLADQPECSAYPWPRHFHRGYPAEVVEEWKRDFS